MWEFFRHGKDSAVGRLKPAHFALLEDGLAIEGPSGSRYLTPLERKLLLVLCIEPGRVVYSRDLLLRVWGPEYVKDSHLLHDYIARLRKAFAAIGFQWEAIENLHGIGYRLTLAYES